jgi:hypothetical protein
MIVDEMLLLIVVLQIQNAEIEPLRMVKRVEGEQKQRQDEEANGTSAL